MMKSYLFKLIFILFIFISFSCDFKKETHHPILGKWEEYATIKNGKYELIKRNTELDGCLKKNYAQFFEDDIFKFAKIDYHTCTEEFTITGNYQISEDILKINYESISRFESEPQKIDDEGNKSNEATYKIEGDLLSITIIKPNETTVFKKVPTK